MHKFLKIAFPLLILGAGIGAFKLLKDTRPQRAAAAIQERVWRVEVEAVQPRNLAPELALYGEVQTPDLLKVAASGQARVAEVAVRDGDRVTKGQFLARLDERDFLPSLHQAQAEVAELNAQILSENNRVETDRKALEQEQTLLQIAADGVERAKRLAKRRVGSETELDKAEETLARQALAVSNRQMSIEDHPARLEALQARLQHARARVAEVELDVERSDIRAPFDCVVSGVEVAAGDQVKQDEVLLRLYSLRDLEVRARIPAPFQAEIRAALASGAALRAATDVGDAQVPLRLNRIAGEARPSGIDGLFSVEGNAEMLRLGQMVSLRLARPKRSDVVALPFQAVYGEGRIYKLANGRMHGIQVETLGEKRGRNGKEWMLVHSPELHPGDQVVVTHMPNAVEGLRVEAIQ